MDNLTEERDFGEVQERYPEPETQDEQGSELEAKPQSEETKEVSQEGGEAKKEEPQLTEKGTKLDPNPQSAVHQQLANERRVRQQYEQVLSNPDLLAQYMKAQFGIEMPSKTEETEAEPEEEIKADDLEDFDGIVKVVNSLKKENSSLKREFEEKVNQLASVVNTVVTLNRQQQIANQIEREASQLMRLPELDKNSPEYVEGLEQKIVERFIELDVDPQTGLHKGQYSLAQVANELIESVRLGKKAGSLKAQTVVKRKAEGKVATTPAVDEETEDEENLPPETSIARGIARLASRR